MAQFDARFAATAVTMNDNAHVDHATQVTNTAAGYKWTTSNGFDITVASFLADIVAAPNAPPTAGTVNTVLAEDAADLTLYLVTGLNAALAPMTLDRPSYWKAVLSGDTTLFAPDVRDFQGYGDIFALNAGSFTGGNDAYTGGSAALALDQDFQGDAFEMDGGTLTGGNDTIDAFGAGELIGDVKFLSAGLANGGRDTITLDGTVDDTGNGTETSISGDVDSIAATARLIAGNDFITVSGVISMQRIAGDAFTAGAGSQFTGGDDTITTSGSPAIDSIFGDVSGQAQNATGGDDFLLVTAEVTRIGGDFRDVSGIAQGGDDALGLAAGVIAMRVSGDADATLASARLTGGDDVINAELVDFGIFASGDVTAAQGRIFGGDDLIVGSAQGDSISGDASVLNGGVLTGGNDTLRGGAGNDGIYGETETATGDFTVTNGGNDRLEGGGGNDTLRGQAGNDTLLGGLGNDLIDGNGLAGVSGGVDTVSFEEFALSVSVDLVAQQALGQGQDFLLNIRNVRGSLAGDAIAGTGAPNVLAGLDGDDVLIGRDGDDTLTGGLGNDTLNGGGGGDSMSGGGGDDSYWVNSTADQTVESAGAGGGTDTVHSTITHTLAANVEALVLEGTANRNGTGNTLANGLTGNSGANVLSGLNGNDTLIGGGGADTLTGGQGNDTLTGGGGADRFRFGTVNTGADRITDFQAAADRFDLSGGTFSDRQVAGADTILTHAGGTIRVAGINNLSLAQWNALVVPAGGGAGEPLPLAAFDSAFTASELALAVRLPDGDWFFA